MPKVTYLQASEPAERTLTTRQLAALLHVSEDTIHRYRRSGEGPPYIEINRNHKVYLESTVLKWMAERTRKSTSDRGN